MRTLESQVEEEYEEKQAALKEKREIERKMRVFSEEAPVANRGQ